MRAVGHALGAVLGLSRHVDVLPACAGGQDHRARLQAGAVGQTHAGQATRLRGGLQRLDTLAVHDRHVVGAHMRLQRGRELRPVGFLDGDVVLDGQRIQRLAAKALGHDAGANAFARRIHSGCRAGRAAADDEHVERGLLREPGGIARGRAGVDLGQDFGQFHAARAEGLAVEEHGRHRHDLARLDLVLEQAAVDGHVAHARVQNRHQVQRLHHVRAVVAGQAHPGLEHEIAVECLDLRDHVGLDLGRVATGLQQRQHQRGELVAHRHGSETHAHVGAGAADLE